MDMDTLANRDCESIVLDCQNMARYTRGSYGKFARWGNFSAVNVACDFYGKGDKIMEKIKSLFVRDMKSKLIINEVTPGCEWVISGEGVPTRKYDGTCCRVLGGRLYKRRAVRRGRQMPANFILCTEDAMTGKKFGWVPVEETDKYHLEGYRELCLDHAPHTNLDGTYELVGPKIQGNPENYGAHRLVKHGAIEFADVPRSFDGLREWLRGVDIEGLVFHHPEYGMAKIKKIDFGLKRLPEAKEIK